MCCIRLLQEEEKLYEKGVVKDSLNGSPFRYSYCNAKMLRYMQHLVNKPLKFNFCCPCPRLLTARVKIGTITGINAVNLNRGVSF